MKKKNNQPSGQLFSPELREITRRLKRKESELDEIVNQERSDDHAGEHTERSEGTGEEEPS